MFEIILQLHGSKGSSTTVSSYQPTEAEERLQEISADYAEAVAPNALWLNEVAADLLADSLGTVQVDYDDLLSSAQNYTSNAQEGVSSLTTGELPSAYQEAMEASIASGVENTLGSAISDLASRGVLSSSVANTSIDTISDSVADSMASSYLSNIETLNSLYGQEASLASNQITNAAAAQEAAQTPALNLWNASLGLGSTGTSTLSALSGTGSTTTTSSSGSGVLSSFLSGLTSNCFAENTKIRTPSGTKYIRHIVAGDKVISYNTETGIDETVIVQAVMTPHYADVYTVACKDDDGVSRFVSVNLDQCFLTADGEFAPVSTLKIGAELKNVGKITAIMYSGNRKIYDIRLPEPNVFYANDFVAEGGTAW